MTLSIEGGALVDAMPRGAIAMFDILADRIRENVGYLLMTVLAPNGDEPFLTRMFSTNLDQYPLGAADPIEDSLWFRRLFTDGEAIVANDAEAIEAWLPGFDAYVAQGYGSLANIPIVVSGTTIGLLNLMDEAGHFTAERIALLRAELPLAALAILAKRM
ncbi:GAF domain-containing protein [Aquibium carbonis]|uniref:GAF domain-containing protein n=1 Tax=Aquibium carbonis TaxID=2495581 RepID=A0A3S0AU21_9HYPH|nr:GAF domain-containing protein [Aquibium carbonis]RST87103.1 GAF domain-containing protein [Aquibium carbonis]